MDNFSNIPIFPTSIMHSRPHRRPSTNLNNDEMNAINDDLTASMETIKASNQQYNSFNDGFNSNTSCSWPEGSNIMSGSDGSSYPTSLFTGTTSHTSDNPDYRTNVSDMPFHTADHTVLNGILGQDPNSLDSVGDQFQWGGQPYRVPPDLESDLQHRAVKDYNEDFPSPEERNQDFQGIISPHSLETPEETESQSQALSQQMFLQEWRALDNAVRAMNAEHPDGCYEKVIQLRQGLGHMCQNVDTWIQNHGPKVSVEEPSPEAPNAHTSARGMLYRCKLSNCTSKATFSRLETFQRHVDNKHHPKIEYHCPWGCDRVDTRRDKMVLHSKEKHLKKPTKNQIDKKKRSLPCPPICPICSTLTRTWHDFNRCIINHSLLEYGAAPSDAASSEHGDEGTGGVGPALDQSSLFRGTVLEGAKGMTASQSQGGHGNSASRRSSTLLSPSYSPTGAQQLASDMLRTFSDGDDLSQAPPSGLQAPQEGRRRSDSYLHPDAVQGLQQPRPPPPPQPQQPDIGHQVQPSCQICGHSYNPQCCNRQNPSERCHVCAYLARVRAARARIPQSIPRNQRGPSHAVAPMFQRMGRYGAPVGGFPVNVSFGDVVWQPQQQQRPGNDGGQGGSLPGSFRGPYNVAMLTSIDGSVLSEDRMGIPLLEPKTADPPFDFTWVSCIPIRVPMPKGLVKVPKISSAVPLEYNGTSALPQVNLPLITPQDNQCRCPCRLKALERSYTKARVELVPGKVLDVNMKILAGDRAGHPLRTRVRVVVKLLKLRSSVARTGNKKATKEDAKAIEKALKTSLDVADADASSSSIDVIENDEDADDPDNSGWASDSACSDSDNESVISSATSATSVSEYSPRLESKPRSPDMSDESDNLDDNALPPSSFSDRTTDLTPYHHEGCDHPLFAEGTEELFDDDFDENIEETELEISMDLDLQTCLSRLSILTDGLADFDQPLPKQKITDPTRIFEYFFRYILYVIFALSRSRNHSSPSLLE